MRYEEPYMEIIELDNSDIVTLSTSDTPGNGLGEEEGGSGDQFGV